MAAGGAAEMEQAGGASAECGLRTLCLCCRSAKGFTGRLMGYPVAVACGLWACGVWAYALPLHYVRQSFSPTSTTKSGEWRDGALK